MYSQHTDKEDQMVVEQQRYENDGEYYQRLIDEIQRIDDALEELERQKRTVQLALDELIDYYENMVRADEQRERARAARHRAAAESSPNSSVECRRCQNRTCRRRRRRHCKIRRSSAP